jgi:hypothetical protein
MTMSSIQTFLRTRLEPVPHRTILCVYKATYNRRCWKVHAIRHEGRKETKVIRFWRIEVLQSSFRDM